MALYPLSISCSSCVRPSAEWQPSEACVQDPDRQDASSQQQEVSDSLSMHSLGASEASVAQSARSGRGAAQQEEPAMISFDDEVGPMASSRSTAGGSLCPQEAIHSCVPRLYDFCWAPLEPAKAVCRLPSRTSARLR